MQPSVSRDFSTGTSDGRPFLVDFVDGESVVDYCCRHSLSIRQRLELFLQVAGTFFAHHSDASGSQAFEYSVTAEGKAYVLDFGIARIAGPRADGNSDLTWRWGVTLQYASPERIAGLPRLYRSVFIRSV